MAKTTPRPLSIDEVVYSPARTQDRMFRNGEIGRDLYEVAKFYRWRGVCSGGGRMRGTNVVGFAMFRETYNRMRRKVEARMKRQRAAARAGR
jgi:hypothetical protein